MRRLTLFFPFAVMLVAAFLATRGDAQPNTVKEIVKGVWFREGDIQGQGHCNNVIIEMSDHLVVVDANFPSGARAVLEDAKKVSNKPIKFVFDTHHHGDHAYGNAVWTKQGAVTIAHIGVTNELKKYEPARWQQTAKERKDVGELGLSTAELPQKTFDGEKYVMKDSMRTVELRHFGWAHTRGDAMAYLPKEKVLCTGDAVTNGPYNYTADGNVQNWPKVIERAQKLDVQYVLPGHGPSGGKEVLEGQKQFFLALVKEVQSAVKAGKKLEDLVEMKGDRPVKAKIQLPDSVKNWTGNSLAGQIRDTYRELTEKKPAGDLPH
jgi:glyoxylase-like metal-dependent hydrolase (beta-lactamase superfamily II)